MVLFASDGALLDLASLENTVQFAANLPLSSPFVDSSADCGQTVETLQCQSYQKTDGLWKQEVLTRTHTHTYAHIRTHTVPSHALGIYAHARVERTRGGHKVAGGGGSKHMHMYAHTHMHAYTRRGRLQR